MSLCFHRYVWMPVALFWLAGCASLDEWQRMKVYRPTPIEAGAWQPELAKYPGVQAQTLRLPQNEQLQVLRFSAMAGNSSKVKVLYLHGTLRHALQNSAKIEGITRNGMDVVAPDYRGWGASTYRIPDETSIHADALAAWQAQRDLEEDHLWVIYGHSMGSAAAVHLAAQVHQRGLGPFCAVVLESAFTSFPDVARSVSGPFGLLAAALTTQKMASIDMIGQVPGPIWLLHGSQDATIPMSLGKRLFAAAPSPKYWLDLPKDHSDLQTDATGAYDAVWQQVKSTCDPSAAKPSGLRQ